jgi:DNA-binding transcriptional LysR family regulator
VDVHNLEGDLGVRFFERHHNGVRLTITGVAFLRDARRVLFEVDRAISNVRRGGRAEISKLGIRFYTSLVVGPLQQVLAAYRRYWSDGSTLLDVVK